MFLKEEEVYGRNGFMSQREMYGCVLSGESFLVWLEPNDRKDSYVYSRLCCDCKAGIEMVSCIIMQRETQKEFLKVCYLLLAVCSYIT